MNWPMEDAEEGFDDLLRAAEQDGPQMITQDGVAVAVVVHITQYRAMAATEEAP